MYVRSAKSTFLYPIVNDGDENLDEQRPRLPIDHKRCCQLADAVQVAPLHPQNVDVRSLCRHALGLAGAWTSLPIPYLTRTHSASWQRNRGYLPVQGASAQNRRLIALLSLYDMCLHEH